MGRFWSYLLAVAIAGGIGLWMWQGDVIRGGRADASNAEPPPAERTAAKAEELFAVRVRTFTAQERLSELKIRGRTEADAKVAVRAETDGRVEEVLVTEGAEVSAGDVLCRLERGARHARLLHARARLAQAELEHTATTTLSDRGFATQMKVATMKAALDAARADVEAAEIELDRTIIRAPISGTVQSPIVETGEVLSISQICANLIDVNPMLFVGQVSERDIGKIGMGDKAEIRTVVGDEANGHIRYVAPSADSETRTFRIEIRIPNGDRVIRDGLTALASIPLAASRAHLISPGFLVLDDAGRLGVRVVEPGDVVAFRPIKILAETASEGIWVDGLDDNTTVIVVGQDYVKEGATVRPIVETAEAQS